MNTDYIPPARQLVDTLRRIYELGMTTTSGGNLSIRDDDGSIWITPGGIDKGTLRPADIVRVLPDGTCKGIHKPSSELPFHRSIYQLRPDARAVIHAHAPAVVAFSMVGRVPEARLLPGADAACGRIAFAKYEIPGSEQLGKVIAAEFAAGADSVIMENHGAVVCADSLLQAFHRFETLDLLARIGVERGNAPEPAAIPPAPAGIAVTPGPASAPSSEECERREELAAFTRRAARQRLLIGGFALLSARLGDDDFLTTCHPFDPAFFDAADAVRVTNGRAAAPVAPAVAAVRAVYRALPQVRSVLFAAAPHIMAFAEGGRAFDSRTIPESYIMLRDVPRLSATEFAADPEAAARLLSPTHPALLVESHGLMTIGATLTEAFDRLEVGDFTAHCLLLAERIGAFSPIGQPAVDELIAAFKLPRD